MKKTLKVSKALATATGVAVFGSVIACGAALLAMKEGFKTAGKIVKQAAKEEESVAKSESEKAEAGSEPEVEKEENAAEQEIEETKINNSETSCEQIKNIQRL